MSAIRDAAIESGVQIWAYTGESHNKHDRNVLFVNHRRFGHIWELFRRGHGAHITDSTHFHLEYPHPALLPLWLASKSVLRFRWIKLLHDGSLPSRYESFGRLRKWLFITAIRHIDVIIVVNRELESWLRRVADFKGNVSFISPLLPLPPNWGDEQLSSSLLEKIDQFSTHKKRVMSIGVFTPSYGFHHVADSIERLRRETDEDIGLLLVDGRFDGDDEYRERVLNGRDWITVAENVPHPALKHVFGVSDVFVRAFAHESFGLSRVEALWCNTPVIATNTGETRGILTFEFGDIEQLCTHLKVILHDPFTADTSQWAAMFREEAKENLEKYLKAITGETAK